MKNPLLAMLLGLFLNVFSLIFFDLRLFLWSLGFYLSLGIAYVFLSPYRMDLFIFLMFNLFFSCFNYYIAGVWNFMQMDDSYTNPWMNAFHAFKKWSLRFISMILIIFALIGFIKYSESFVAISLKVTALLVLAPTALMIVEYFISIIISTICTAFKLPTEE